MKKKYEGHIKRLKDNSNKQDGMMSKRLCKLYDNTIITNTFFNSMTAERCMCKYEVMELYFSKAIEKLFLAWM